MCVSTLLRLGNGFGLIPLSLPTGVTAADVKMMFAAYQVHVITTCIGDVYTLAFDASVRGANGGGKRNAWSRVQKSTGGFLTNVVALRGSSQGLFALDATGNLFTWGNSVRPGAGGGAVNLITATAMTLPTGTGANKMIRMASRRYEIVAPFRYFTTYYLLYENDSLYAMGSNAVRQI